MYVHIFSTELFPRKPTSYSCCLPPPLTLFSSFFQPSACLPTSLFLLPTLNHFTSLAGLYWFRLSGFQRLSWDTEILLVSFHPKLCLYFKGNVLRKPSKEFLVIFRNPVSYVFEDFTVSPWLLRL